MLSPVSLTGLTIVGGNGQIGSVGASLPNALAVKVGVSGRAGISGVPVAFAATTGAATLSADSVLTGPDGTAAVLLTLGTAAGTVKVTASVEGLPSVTFTATSAPAGPPAPRISSGGVVGGGLNAPTVKQISPNGIASVFGENFAPAGTQRLVGVADLVNGHLPTNLSGVCLRVGLLLAPIFHVFPAQVNFQVPSLTSDGSVPVQVILNCGTANETKSNIETVTLQAAAPEFFFFAHNTDGHNPIAALNATRPGLVGAVDLFPGTTAPAQPNDAVTLFTTGFGMTTPAFAAGELPSGIGVVVQRVRVTLGGVELGPEEILYAGVSPFSAGLYQLNIRIPTAVPDGDLPVRVQIGDFVTPPGGFLSVKR